MNEIFNLGGQEIKPKKKLSEKQLQALEAGRLKRDEKKKQKLEIDGYKEQKQNKTIQHKVQKDLLQEQEKIKNKMIDTQQKQEQPPQTQEPKTMDELKLKLKSYMVDTLSKIDDPAKFKATKQYLDNIYQLSTMNDIKTKLETDYKTINKK
jgi:hypothetical protein